MIPAHVVNPNVLLDHAPRSLAEMPAWFASITFEQFDRVWLAALIAVITEDRTQRFTVADLQAALDSARARYRDPSSQPASRSVRLGGSALKPSTGKYLESLLAGLPQAGDSVFLRDISGSNGSMFNSLRQWAASRPDWCRVDRTTEGLEKGSRLRITRISSDHPLQHGFAAEVTLPEPMNTQQTLTP